MAREESGWVVEEGGMEASGSLVAAAGETAGIDPAALPGEGGSQREGQDGSSGEVGGASFGQVLKELRLGRGLSQAAVAARAGVDRSYVNRLEAGERAAPGPAAVEALAEALQLTDAEADRLLAAAGLLPRSLRRLGPADPTLLLLAQRLTDRNLSPAARAALRAAVTTIARHWSERSDV